jgi:cytochrome c-type biogenesis protein CcsB
VYGVKEMKLPFALKLKDFQLDRYPGSQSPSSFASEVTLIDESNNINENYRIFMNNVLEHKGYRFYQSSYDEDEKGTILSVNHDKTGTVITYCGYILMILGMIWSLIQKNSLFAKLSRRMSAIRIKRNTIIPLFTLIFLFGAQEVNSQDIDKNHYDREHSKAFGELLIQDQSGRIKPINTLSNDLLRKISRKEKWENFNSTQVFLGMISNPNYWKGVKMIKVGHADLIKRLGLEGNYVSFNDLVNPQIGVYKLKQEVEKAFAKQVARRDKYDKEVIAVDERFNISYQIYSMQYLKVFPVPGDIDKSWVTPIDFRYIKDTVNQEFVRTAFSKYFTEISKALLNNNWSEANTFLESIQVFQKQYAAEILPSDIKVKMEVHYLNLNIFKRIFKYYGLVGFVFLIILFIGILSPNLKLNAATVVSAILLGILFLLHTYGLGLRWYISGHAPFSNSYESMIYIAWALMLAGFIFLKKSPITLAATALLASITLMVANLSWMNPEITNLVPVLKSFWLIVHVSVITASYGFLALGALIGLLSLVTMIFVSKKNVDRLDLTISELSNVNHMALIIGLYLLTIGTFLGAVWANESWGRYWGWDPKETWALISIIVYAFIVHTRFIPFFNNKFSFNFLSLIGFSSILMTYFGVNYYLSGLHSYAQGDPVPIPYFVYYLIGFIFVISLIAFVNSKKIIFSTERKEE